VQTPAPATTVAPALTHLIYSSAACAGLKPEALEDILASARTNNARREVTGMLLHTSGSFFQVLEGEEATLLEIFAVIGADKRHERITKIIHEPIVERAFGSWSMGFAEAGADELGAIEGLEDFFRGQAPLAHIPPGRASKLLAAFTQGRWRSRIAGAPVG